MLREAPTRKPAAASTHTHARARAHTHTHIRTHARTRACRVAVSVERFKNATRVTSSWRDIFSFLFLDAQWPTDTLSWKAFRDEVLGATDPKAAAAGSVRRVIYESYQSLDLPGRPNTGDNGVHASASPLEALAERANWLKVLLCVCVLPPPVSFLFRLRGVCAHACACRWRR